MEKTDESAEQEYGNLQRKSMENAFLYRISKHKGWNMQFVELQIYLIQLQIPYFDVKSIYHSTLKF